jgi:hypothetical protein
LHTPGPLSVSCCLVPLTGYLIGDNSALQSQYSIEWRNLAMPALTATWNTIPAPPSTAQISQIAWSDDGTLWGIDDSVTYTTSAQNLYAYTGGSNGAWQSIDAYVTAIGVQGGGIAWCVNTNSSPSDVFVLSGYLSSAVTITPVTQSLTSICVGHGGDVWGVDTTQPVTSNQNIFRYIGGDFGWQQIVGYLTSISAGGRTPGGSSEYDGSVWGLNTNEASNNVYRYVGGSTPFVNVPGVSLTQISVAADGTVVGIDSTGNIWGYDFVGNQWTQIVGTATAIAAGSAGLIWIISSGAIQYALLSDFTLSFAVDSKEVYKAKCRMPTTPSTVVEARPLRASLEVIEEHWLDSADQSKAISRHPVQKDETSSALEVAKLVWQIVKEGTPTYSGPRSTQSSILNPADSNWIDYQNAILGSAPSVSYRLTNYFNVDVVDFVMKFAGSYNAQPALSSLTPGCYVPDMHFEFSKSHQSWGFKVNGYAVVSGISNLGGVTAQNPVNPYATISVVLEVATWFWLKSASFSFAVTGRSGFTTLS